MKNLLRLDLPATVAALAGLLAVTNYINALLAFWKEVAP